MLALLLVIMTGCSSPQEKAVSLTNQGFASLEEGKIIEAMSSFKEALRLKDQSKNKKALWGLILAYEKLGDYKHMFELCRQLAEIDHADIEVNLKLANLYLIADNVEPVKDLIKRMDAVGKNNPDVIAFKAEVQFRYGNWAEAEKLAEMALTLDKKNSSAYMTLAKLAGSNGDYNKALNYIDNAIQKNPKNSSLYLAKVSILQDSNLTEQLPSVYLKLIELNPNDMQYKRQLAWTYVERLEFSKAEKLLEGVLDINPDNVESKMGLVKLVNVTRGKQSALDLLQRFVKEDSENITLLFAQYAFLKEVGEYESSMRVLKGIIDSTPNLNERFKAVATLADDMLNLGFRPQAEAMVNEVLNKDTKNGDALLLKAKLQMFDRNYNAAISIYRNLLDDYPNLLPALIGLGQAYEQSDALELANETYFQAFKTANTIADVRDGYIHFLIKHGMLERAENVLKDLIHKSPGDVVLLKQLALLKIDMKDNDGALQIGDKLILTPSVSALGYQVKAKAYQAAGDYQQSLLSYKSAYAADLSQPIYAEEVLNLYLEKNDLKNARLFVDSALSRKPDDYALGMLDAKLSLVENKQKALEVYKMLIETNPKRSEAYLAMAKILNQDGQAALAQESIAKGLRFNPDDIQLNLMMTDIFLKQQSFDKALAVLKEQIKKHPNDYVTRNNLANLLMDYGADESEVMRGCYIAQTFIHSEIPEFMDTVAWSDFKQGRYSVALNILKTVVEQSPNQYISYYHLYRVYSKLGNKSLSESALAKAKSLAQKESVDASENLGMLLSSQS